jgi:murein DD-endopeptidase MepM/ murein hydrolase activator NlpD
MIRRHLTRLSLAILALSGLASSSASPPLDEAPFRLPFAAPSGPDTWLVQQPYGNTVFAYRFRRSSYAAGQGLHFGVDFSAPCGTPVLAIGEGTVAEVDSQYHGAGPHNLMIDHPNGYASFYGHLLTRPLLKRGDKVSAGQIVAHSGDPDLTCNARPHLHLEIRDARFHSRAYNPMSLIDANWEALVAFGSSPVRFEQNMALPQRWQSLFDQPQVKFGGPLLNDYLSPWPEDP